ncbi:hypothetical protein NX801_00260 [Streptomyces sp. LP05-1]|uniref:Uncharacterized protein n=1 Tax=Streptomyces pyxinae TaxID=2970734 RepID=A0ABT2C9P9_9ACTN|nr:hypothetical protein [Streptomyces sp. LP05-1]MCS0634121.1 hypothetical protein [Streptomyces sp. LP05-1]
MLRFATALLRRAAGRPGRAAPDPMAWLFRHPEGVTRIGWFLVTTGRPGESVEAAPHRCAGLNRYDPESVPGDTAP